MPALWAALEGFGDLGAQRERALQPRGTLLQKIAQRLPLQVLLHHVMDGALGADVVYGSDVRVVERGGCPSLLLESRQALGVGGELGGQHLHGHLAAQAGVLCQPHLTHAPGAELLEDLVGAEPGSLQSSPPSLPEQSPDSCKGRLCRPAAL